MKRTKSFRFTTGISPETEITLSGRRGAPLTLNIDDRRDARSIRLDTESVIRLQAFLSDYLQEDASPSPKAPSFEPTGRALAVMDADTLDILRVFRTGSVVGLGGTETDSYRTLCDKLRSLADMDVPPRAVFIFFDTYDGSISQGVIRRILRACISYQADFVRSGDASRSRRMVLGDIEAFTALDSSVISRATRDVRIISEAGTFTLNAADPSIDVPSLFDEGMTRGDGSSCSRKEVLGVLRRLVTAEGGDAPMTDEALAGALSDCGYRISRRTVTKYREILGIPKSCGRAAPHALSRREEDRLAMQRG